MKLSMSVVVAFAVIGAVATAGCAADSESDDAEEYAPDSEVGEVGTDSAALLNNHYLTGACNASHASLLSRARTACRNMGKPAPTSVSYTAGRCPGGDIPGVKSYGARINFKCGTGTF